MRAIQSFLLHPRHTEINRIFVNAKPEQAWETTRHFDAAEIPWVKLLFDIRTLPERLFDKNENHEPISIGVDEVTKSGSGFQLLAEIPGREVVVGSVGQFWHLNIPFKHVAPEDFAQFDEPGWGKLAWAITVEPYRQGSAISIELRTTATDEQSWKSLSHYYSLIGIGSKLIRHSSMKRLEAALGKMQLPDTDSMPLPGDEIISDTPYSITDEIVIEAPPFIVWRYLMQFGCDRGGWYSIDRLDNGGKPSVDHIVEEWNDRLPGDRLAATPAGDAFFEVYQVSKNKHFVIGGESEKAQGLLSPFKMTWAFVPEPVGEDATRLLVRVKMKASPAWAEWLAGEVLYRPVHGLMEGVQMRTVKRLAERDAQLRGIAETELVLQNILP
jgi:hypothetical protein